jgi:hypothetical protein
MAENVFHTSQRLVVAQFFEKAVEILQFPPEHFESIPHDEDYQYLGSDNAQEQQVQVDFLPVTAQPKQVSVSSPTQRPAVLLRGIPELSVAEVQFSRKTIGYRSSANGPFLT